MHFLSITSLCLSVLLVASLPACKKEQGKSEPSADTSGADNAGQNDGQNDGAKDGAGAAKAKPALADLPRVKLPANALTPSANPKSSPDDITPIEVPPSKQNPGDPKAGYVALVDGGYVGCGVPWSMSKDFVGDVPDESKLPGRTGANVDLNYRTVMFKTPSGVEVLGQNCLTCHAGDIDGELVVGLGNTTFNLTRAMRMPPKAAALAMGAADGKEFLRWYERVSTVDPHLRTRTIGVNPADTIAAVLFSYRDPKTLAWLDTPAIPLPDRATPLDVPPWWHVKKKNALYYTASARGDFSRPMMLASTLCVDSVEHATAVAKTFKDIRAYLATIEPPPYKQKIDGKLAKKGEGIFDDNCAECHGTYGEKETYPNLVIPLDDLGTDPLVARGGAFYSERYLKWYAESFFGQTSRLEPEDGYIAPPLDGIWASAPYLHNGSVPTVRAILDSKSRPKYWTRIEDSYDHGHLGWQYDEAKSHAETPDEVERAAIYDTTIPGYFNTGHLFGDALSEDERTAVIEYLKTL